MPKPNPKQDLAAAMLKAVRQLHAKGVSSDDALRQFGERCAILRPEPSSPPLATAKGNRMR